MNEAEVLQKKLDRAQRKVEALEALIEDRSRELYAINEALRANRDGLEKVLDATPGPLLVLDETGAVTQYNQPALELIGVEPRVMHRLHVSAFWTGWSEFEEKLKHGPFPIEAEVSWSTHHGDALPVLLSMVPFGNGGAVVIGLDLRERKKLEGSLHHAQKLETLGQLSASVAHEINTPLQYLSDHVAFLSEECGKLVELCRVLQRRAPEAWQRSLVEANVDDFDFLEQQLPASVQQTHTGLFRVTEIIRALKTFSHPSSRATPADFNACVKNALTIARGELKHVQVDMKLGDLPPVVCIETEVQQLVMNLLVNAGHAIAGHQGSGNITVSTRLSQWGVQLCVEDDGGGIPEEVQPRIFESFFTTKPAGQGTGQGLALCQRVVSHAGGRLWFETEPGRGTKFLVDWPLSSSSPSGVMHVEASRAVG